MSRHDDLDQAITSFQRTEEALKEAFEHTRELQSAASRLSDTEKHLRPVAEAVSSAADSLSTLEGQFANLLPALEAATHAYLEARPAETVAAVSAAQNEVASLARSVDEWRNAFASALGQSSEQLQGLTSAVDALKSEVSVVMKMIDDRLDRWNREQAAALDQVGQSLRLEITGVASRLEESSDELAVGHKRITMVGVATLVIALVAAVAALLALA